jgi:hypothetical protein
MEIFSGTTSVNFYIPVIGIKSEVACEQEALTGSTGPMRNQPQCRVDSVADVGHWI